MGDKKEKKKSRNGWKRKQEKKKKRERDGNNGRVTEKNTDTVFPYLMASLSQD
jgi:hypothetical protein